MLRGQRLKKVVLIDRAAESFTGCSWQHLNPRRLEGSVVLITNSQFSVLVYLCLSQVSGYVEVLPEAVFFPVFVVSS